MSLNKSPYKVTAFKQSDIASLPADIQAVYQTLRSGSEEFAEDLHDIFKEIDKDIFGVIQHYLATATSSPVQTGGTEPITMAPLPAAPPVAVLQPEQASRHKVGGERSTASTVKNNAAGEVQTEKKAQPQGLVHSPAPATTAMAMLAQPDTNKRSGIRSVAKTARLTVKSGDKASTTAASSHLQDAGLAAAQRPGFVVYVPTTGKYKGQVRYADCRFCNNRINELIKRVQKQLSVADGRGRGPRNDRTIAQLDRWVKNAKSIGYVYPANVAIAQSIVGPFFPAALMQE